MPTRLAAALIAAAALLTGCSAWTVSGHPSAASRSTPSSGVPVRTATYTYSGSEKLYAHWAPGRTGAPWIVFVHGGGWYTGSGDTSRVRRLAAREVQAGYQFFSVDYRLTEIAPWPAQRDDVTAAVAWIRQHAARFGLGTRGVAIGESAGGQLAAIVGSQARLAGVVSLAGPMNPIAALSAPSSVTRRAAAALVRCRPAACPADWRSTLAATYIGTGTPPTLILHSRNDPLVPVTMSYAYAADLRRAGRQVTLDVVPGSLHSVIDAPGAYDVLQRFLAAVTG